MRRFLSVCISMIMLVSCGGKVASDIPWNDARGEVCRVYMNYIDALASGDIDAMFSYEDQLLWPSLNFDQYSKLRSLHSEFRSLLSRSRIEFVECTNQKEWGIYGRKYDTAYMFTFKVIAPADITQAEKQYEEIFKTQSYTTAGVLINGAWKFVPVFGPELFEISSAIKAYKEYLTAVSDKDFSRIYDFTPEQMQVGVTTKDVEKEWLANGAQLPDVIKYGKPTPVLGKITFNPSYGKFTYDWGVLLEVTFDSVNVTARIPKQDKQTGVIIEDYKQGNTSVLMVFEDRWKPLTLNPLFGAPGQQQQH